MRVLWISNIIFPEAVKQLKGEDVSLKISGGWLISSAYTLIQSSNLTLAVASVSRDVDELFHAKGESGIDFYLIPYGRGNLSYNKEYETYWRKIMDSFKPDIVHLHGTEYSHGLACLSVCRGIKTVLSIQGVMGEISKNIKGGLSFSTILRNLTLYDVFRGSSIWKQAREFRKRAKVEHDILERIEFVIGRTEFDKESVLRVNKNIKYFKVNESLRDEFYSEPLWDCSKCIPHRIFVSQSTSPLRGLHILLQALPDVITKYPDTQLHVAGSDLIKADSLRDKLRLTGYGKLLRSLIYKYGLEKAVVFTDKLDANGMKQEYLNANVFICSSANENSSNSVCEAQMLGVPCIASNVGGIPNLIIPHKTGWLYEYDDIRSLSAVICDVFSGDATHDSKEVIRIARERHNKQRNNADLINTYHEIMRD